VQHHRAHVASVIAERAAWTPRSSASPSTHRLRRRRHDLGRRDIHRQRREGLHPCRAPAQRPASRRRRRRALSRSGRCGIPPRARRSARSHRRAVRLPSALRFAREMIAKNVRTFRTTSAAGYSTPSPRCSAFTREITFEGQAAMWLEHLATDGAGTHVASPEAYELPLRDDVLDHRPLLAAIVHDRLRARTPERSRSRSTPRSPPRSSARTNIRCRKAARRVRRRLSETVSLARCSVRSSVSRSGSTRPSHRTTAALPSVRRRSSPLASILSHLIVPL